jgi:uncharacterized radical SAM superfamily protein
MDKKAFLDVLEAGSLAPERRRIHFYAPSFMYYKTRYYRSSPKDFPTISVTGNSCALNCKHCGGTVLETMYPAQTPKRLFELCAQLKREGALGCLISGGCVSDGSVPVSRFVGEIERVKRELDLTVFVHTGILDHHLAKELKKARVDAVLIDVIGSDETIREICKLNATVQDYSDSLSALHEVGVPFVPHVIVGLHYGRLRGEFRALQTISRYEPSAVVIIAFMPIHGTEMERVKPPEPIDVARVVATARLMSPGTPLVLGCMRPKGKHRAKTDVMAVQAGVDAIAFPTEEGVEFADSQGFETVFSSLCCSQVFADLGASHF